MQVTVHVTGLDNVNARLEKLGASLTDFTNALAILGKSLIIFYSQTVFISQGTALGKRWAPLKPATIHEKERLAGSEGGGVAMGNERGDMILVRSGKMQGSFYSRNDANTLLVSNKQPYFPYHQLGTSPGSGRGHNIPKRPMIGVNPRVDTIIKKVLSDDIKAKIASTNI